jgi:ribosomal protein S18 acetylase RimI-like enzyme
MKTRQAQPDDAADIYEVHASAPDSMPWENPAECRRHVEWMIAAGNPPIVAEAGGAVVAEMEFWWGQDVPELGRSLDVSMLYVHRDHQRRGAGGALIDSAVRMAREKGCDCVSVWTAQPAIGFYEKHGFRKRLLLRTFIAETARGEWQPPWAFRPARMAGLAPPDGSSLLTGRLVHPRQRWHNFCAEEADPPAWKGSGARRQAIFCHLAEPRPPAQPAIAVYRLAYWSGDAETAELYLWSPDRRRTALPAAMALAREIGIRTLRIMAYGQVAAWLAELGEQAGEECTILARRLRRGSSVAPPQDL